MINSQINNIDSIYEALDVNSNLPQFQTSDRSLKNIQDSKLYRTKPAKGMGYTARKSNISIVMVEIQEAKVNLDTRAYCTCVGKSYLKTIVPDWEEKHIKIQRVKFSMEPLGDIIGHEVDIILNVEKPYPPLLRRPASPASPRAREALEGQIKELTDLGVLRKLGHNQQVELTTPVIITWHNGKFRIVGVFGALNTYTIPERYLIRRIHETLIQLSQDKLITTMDSL
ncbi:hypothetical protein O181_056408 [Austropuccinia psidii MF-1]|uniref:Uncharacterized protein n=1 Tax=Austropuccinia psidii MF-1 TaxID=1389203 RepID=A0A9Q3E9J2_9BASI|nr:hypothetical protein [Austropuccinia psidii MF-1]